MNNCYIYHSVYDAWHVCRDYAFLRRNDEDVKWFFEVFLTWLLQIYFDCFLAAMDFVLFLV